MTWNKGPLDAVQVVGKTTRLSPVPNGVPQVKVTRLVLCITTCDMRSGSQ